MQRMRFSMGLAAAILFSVADGRSAQFSPRWNEYRVILWIDGSDQPSSQRAPLFFKRLRELGINTGMIYNDGDPRFWSRAAFPYYLENLINRGLCLKFNSSVTDWDRFVTAWTREGRPASAFVRDYCLDDPKWRQWARGEMRELAGKHGPAHPVAYDIRDELSVTTSANPFDYDFNPLALAAFRNWLRQQYPSLADLNREWDCRFADWNSVAPFSTDQIKSRMADGRAQPSSRPDWPRLEQRRFDPVRARQNPVAWNFSPWADFRSYMDQSLAGALDDLRQAARAVDPATPVGIEGAQMPDAFGGYDLWRLSQAVDWIEPYDIGDAREIFGSFMPDKPIVTTVFENDSNHARRRLWHLLLEGDCGCIVWWSRDCLDRNSPDWRLTAKGAALAPVLHEMAGDLAKLFLRARRETDPIAIHYSQPSIQVDWLLESTADGASWVRRFSSFEADHNRFVKIRSGWLKLLQDLGYSPIFVSSEQIEHGALATNRVLLLPKSLALSANEASAIGRFLKSGAALVSDGPPGLFDAHGKLLPRGLLSGLFPSESLGEIFVIRAGRAAEQRRADLAQYSRARLGAQPDAELARWIAAAVPFPPPIRISPESRVRVFRHQLGPARLLAFERNVDYQMSEDLKQAGGNERLEQPVEITAAWDAPAYVYDLRSGAFLGQTNSVRVTVDPWQPTLLALLPHRFAGTSLTESLLKY